MLRGSSNVSSANGEYVTGLLVNTSPPIEKKVLSSVNTAIPCDIVKENDRVGSLNIFELEQDFYEISFVAFPANLSVIVWIETLFKV